MYHMLSDAEASDDAIDFLWSKLWWKVIPLKVFALSWKTICGRLATKNNMFKKGIQVGDGAVGNCPICASTFESVNHLLISCLGTLLMVNHLFLFFRGRTKLHTR